MKSNLSRQNPPAERAVLVGLDFARGPAASRDQPTASEYLEELKDLARSAGAEVVHSTIQHLNAPNAATLIGAGKVEELALLRETEDIGVFLFDVDLSPTQQRNLERRLGAKVIDRTQLI